MSTGQKVGNENDQRAECHRTLRQDEGAPFRMGRIDNRPGGRLHTESNQTANGSHTLRYGPRPPRTSARKKFRASRERGRNPGCGGLPFRGGSVCSDSGSSRDPRGALPGGSCLTDSSHSDSSRSTATRIAFYGNWTNEL
jgi:hypothetical protein